MIKKLKVTIFAKFIFFFVTLCFLFGIYLSIPVLFNYKSIENIIESKFYSSFNINLNIKGDIKYQLLPKPHLLISDSSLVINENNNEDISFDIKNLKVFVNSNSLYPKSKLNFEKFEIQNTNFLIKKKEYKALKNYFNTSESKQINIKKSKIFVLDEKDETLIISPIKKISYITSEQDNFKKLIIDGNLFDLNFKSLWKKKYNSEMISQVDINFKRPNILIKNELNYKANNNLQGSTLINFLNKNIEIEYKLKNNIVYLKSPENNNDIKINTTIELKPFYLNSNITLNRNNLNFLIDELVFSILNLSSNMIGNLNGVLKLSLINVEHELIKDGYIIFNIEDKSIKLNKIIFNLSDIGVIESKINYEEEMGELIFKSSNVLKINNKKNFAKKFQINQSKVNDLNKIFFKMKKNINTGSILIFDININQIDETNKYKKEHLYNIRNSQELKLLIKKIVNN